MITTALHINISREDPTNDNRSVMALLGLPPGTRVIVYVGSRWVDSRVAHLLGEYVHLVHLDVQGSDWDAVERWSSAIASAPAGRR